MATFKIGKLVMKSLFRKPATLMYPVIPRVWQERTRGQIGIREEDCIVCGICAKKCPANAISVDRSKRTWTIERMQCIQCNSCVESCPKTCLTMENQYTEPGPEKIVDTVEIPKVEKPAAKARAKSSAPTEELKCNLEECIYCGICSKNCPCDAIKVDRKDKVWEVDNDACAACGVCVEKCPKKCLTLDSEAKADDQKPEADEAKADDQKPEADEPKADEKAEYSCPEDEDGLRCKLSDCIYCGLCVKACPVEALEVDRKEKIWKVDKDVCVTCEACVDQCPKKCLEIR